MGSYAALFGHAGFVRGLQWEQKGLWDWLDARSQDETDADFAVAAEAFTRKSVVATTVRLAKAGR